MTTFPDLHVSLSAQAAVVEANRCLNCFDAPCTIACPTHIDVPGFIKRIATQNLRGSALRILDANILGFSCSRACPADVLCEGSCVMHSRGEKPIRIGLLQRHAMEKFYENGASLNWVPAASNGRKVACIGGGPASLACAAELRKHGFEVTVFDRRPLAGGLNTFGVAEYKLRTTDAQREIELVVSLGVKIETGRTIGADLQVKDIEAKFDAIFIGVGLGAATPLPFTASDGPQTVDALSFIEAYKSGSPIEPGRRVVVIGGGNTAIDAAVAARRLGAEDTVLVYRRGEKEMPAFTFEIEHAQREGIRFEFRAIPVEVTATSLRCTRLGETLEIPCDMVIGAIGQSKLIDLLATLHGVRVEEGKVVVEARTGRTTNPKYYAGGDCVSGGREVVDAVAEGKRAALGIVEAFHG